MKGFCLEVSGDFACFARQEMKVERVSYDVITPSAARNIYQCLFWKPACRYRITRIDVLNPIKWATIRRNEVKAVANDKSQGIFIEDSRTQRMSLLLRDVRYRLWAEMDYILPADKELPGDSPEKYMAMFERRATKGQYFTHPYLGSREFSCHEIRLVKDPDNESVQPIAESRDLGWMLYDKDYSNPKHVTSKFFHAIMENGVIRVPHPDSEEVVK